MPAYNHQAIFEKQEEILKYIQDDAALEKLIRETSHTNKMHVGLPDVFLVERVDDSQQQGKLTPASTFFDDASKLDAIRKTIEKNSWQIASFLVNPSSMQHGRVFEFIRDHSIGKGYNFLYSEAYSKVTDVVIEKSSNKQYPFRIKTAYPSVEGRNPEIIRQTGFSARTTTRQYNALSPLEKTRNDIKIKYDLDHVHISRDGEILRVAMMNGDDPLGFKGQHNDQDYIDYMYLTADGAICFGIEQDGELVFVPMEIMAEHCPDGVEMMQEIQQEYGERFLLDHTQEQDREETKERDYRNFDDWLH